MTRVGRSAVVLAFCCVAPSGILAQDAGDLSPVSFFLNGQERTIQQGDAISDASVASFFSRSDDCAGICIEPMTVSENVVTIDELAVIDFIASQVVNGTGLLIDSREPDARAPGAIASAVNLPASLLSDDNPFRSEILVALGAREFEGIYNFADAIPLVVFDNGPSATDATDFVNTLIALGYPSDRIEYYRGGMQVWTALGLGIEGI